MALQELPDNHDLNHLRLALEFVKSFRTAIDAGAHRGIWTRQMMQSFDKVWAFEADIDLLAQNPAKYKKWCALGETFGWCGIDEGPENTGQGHVVEGDTVEMFPLDAFDIEEVDFLKIDVEGYELHVLHGATDTILDWKPVILLEKNGLCRRYKVFDEEIDEYLNKLGYKCRASWNKDFLYTT